jgi:hypothetical protein
MRRWSVYRTAGMAVIQRKRAELLESCLRCARSGWRTCERRPERSAAADTTAQATKRALMSVVSAGP